MAILGFELDEIARLIALMEAQGLDEFIYQDGERYLRLRGPRYAKNARQPAAVQPAPAASVSLEPRRAIAPRRPNAASSVPEAAPADQVILESPMVGVFYRSSQPGSPPFVEIGQAVAVDQPIGMIEAMKVFSEVKAEHAGVVVSIPAQDGKLVQAGTALVILKREPS